MLDTFMTAFKHHNHTPIGIPEPVPAPPHPHPVFELRRIGSSGQRALFVTFGIMAFSTAFFALAALRTPARRSIFQRITMLIVLFASLSYWCMAMGYGKSIVRVPESDKHHHDHKHGHIHSFREVYWAREVDWLITTPLLLLDLALLAGMAPLDIASLLIADIFMILFGFVAALDSGVRTRWIPYTISCFAFVYIIFKLYVSGRATAAAKGEKVVHLFTSITIFAMVVWTVYPIIFVLAEGPKKISPDTEVIAYAVLDILAKPVFGFWLLFAQHRWEDDVSFLLPQSAVEPVGGGQYGALATDE